MTKPREELARLQRAGHSRTDLATEAGVDLSALAKWLRGQKTLSAEAQQRVCAVLARWEAEHTRPPQLGELLVLPGGGAPGLPQFADDGARLKWVSEQIYELAQDKRSPAVRLDALKWLHGELTGKSTVGDEDDGAELLAKLERLAGEP
jgi:transcriptional regulator with XRE-family HTH domain